MGKRGRGEGRRRVGRRRRRRTWRRRRRSRNTIAVNEFRAVSGR